MRPCDRTDDKRKGPSSQADRLRRVTGDQQGMALAMALFLVLIFSGLCVYALDLTHAEIPMAIRQRNAMQTFYVADAGIERAYASLRAALNPGGAADFDTVLTTNGGYLDLDGSGTAGAAIFETLTVNGTVAGQYQVRVVNNRNDTGATYVTGAPFTVPVATVQSSGGATDDTDKIVYVLSTGQITVGSMTYVRQIEARYAPTGLSAFTAGCGANNPGLQISGNPSISGSQGSVHVNCNANFSGNPSISQNLTSSGTSTITGGSMTVGGQSVAVATAAGDIKNNQPVIPIPPVVPANYRNSSYLRSDATAGVGNGDYILRVELDLAVTVKRITNWDVTGTNPTTTTVAIAGPGASLDWVSGGAGWKFTGGSSGVWDWQGSNVPAHMENRAFYFERASATQNALNGSVTIGSSPPSGGGAWAMTVIADGHINVSGNPTLQPTDHSGNIQLIAGTDIQLGGTVTSTPATGGIVAAREQIQINGNGSFVGIFVAEDAANTDTFVNATQINGNPSITYNGAPPPPSTWNLPLVRTSWRQIQ